MKIPDRRLGEEITRETRTSLTRIFQEKRKTGRNASRVITNIGRSPTTIRVRVGTRFIRFYPNYRRHPAEGAVKPAKIARRVLL